MRNAVFIGTEARSPLRDAKLGDSAANNHASNSKPDERPLNGRGAESRRLISLDFVNGTDYFADFDVNVGDPKPPPGSKGCTFDYVDVTSPNSTWVGQWLSHYPHVAFVPEFLTDAECDALVAEAKPKMFRSQVAPYKNSNANPVNDVRTSSQTWLNPGYGVAKKVIDRVMHLMRQFPHNAHEELQILRYQLGQKYDAHNDYFDPALYGPQANNRAATAYLYLSDVAAGGETHFPRAGGRPPPMEYRSCDTGLSVRPKKRALAIFYDMDCQGRLDPTSLHGGCPVKEGVKWAGTLWLRR